MSIMSWPGSGVDKGVRRSRNLTIDLNSQFVGKFIILSDKESKIYTQGIIALIMIFQIFLSNLACNSTQTQIQVLLASI